MQSLASIEAQQLVVLSDYDWNEYGRAGQEFGMHE
jgi:hypothetical protein